MLGAVGKQVVETSILWPHGLAYLGVCANRLGEAAPDDWKESTGSYLLGETKSASINCDEDWFQICVVFAFHDEMDCTEHEPCYSVEGMALVSWHE